MKLTMAFSPCPNDTFIFEPIVNDRIDTEGLEFVFTIADVEELNRAAFSGIPDITKLSYHAYMYVADSYILLNSGSALGYGNGPLLISKLPVNQQEVSELHIAIPGKYTTANLLLGIAFPGAVNKTEYLFSDIEDAILTGKVNAGLIIHENRFTYEKKGLRKIVDLGEYWEKKTGLPIPLGGIAVHRRIPFEIRRKVDRTLKRSIEYARNNPDTTLEFVRQYAQEMDRDVMLRHIDLYVNEFTRELGAEGKKAVKLLFQTAWRNGLIDPVTEKIFD
ncbi:MAG: 1,4-dihydroxy-6-naphthoate synthase [Bacteroidetes bacterium]|nr:1,4-dihydroxy-6-naphthoate synthase [Bacteroidota bacterium]